MNTDLLQLVAAAADLCRKPLRHAVRVPAGTLPPATGGLTELEEDLTLLLEVRDPDGSRRPEEDLELELYRSSGELHLMLGWLHREELPLLWQGSHPVWMDGVTGVRCERPGEGMPLEALARRLRALLSPDP
jgi:hypothetical protein